jgi:hypothetical protein
MVDQRIRETRATMRWLLTFSLSSAPFVVASHVQWARAPRFELDVGSVTWLLTVGAALFYLGRLVWLRRHPGG